jgi:hypothetical protein
MKRSNKSARIKAAIAPNRTRLAVAAPRKAIGSRSAQ